MRFVIYPGRKHGATLPATSMHGVGGMPNRGLELHKAGNARSSRHIRRPVALAVVACCGAFTALPTAAATLDVRLDHLRPDGELHVALYRDAASWRRQLGAFAERTLPRPAPNETLRFDGLPPGRYAVSARQDAGNDALSRPMLLVLPRHGDSGGGASLQASFERAAISVGTEDPSVRVHLYTDSQY